MYREMGERRAYDTQGQSGRELYEREGEQPYLAIPCGGQAMESMREEERDLRRMQSMYPDAAKLMLSYVEEECDKMEYEGSPMFDEYPDLTTVYRIGERIFGQVKDRLPKEPEQEAGEMLAMQFRGPARAGKCPAQDLARVLLLQEMHHRRRRHAAVRNAAAFAISAG